MTKKTDKLLEYQTILDKCLVMCEFLKNNSPDNYKFIFDNMKSNLEQGFKNKNYKGLKSTYRDLKEWVKGAPVKELEKFNHTFFIKFGEGLDSVNITDKIIKRGMIINDDEFRLIDKQVNDLCQTEPQSSEIEILNKLLLEYHEKCKKS